MRLFIASPISAEVEKELTRVIAALTSSGGPVKWVAPSNIHLTLKFLGEADEQLLPDLRLIIDETAKKHKAVESGLSGLGAFPNLNRARVYWVGLAGGKEQLASIARDLENKVYKLGFEKENRPFKSHLTLGRVKTPQGLQKHNDVVIATKVSQILFKFDRIILFKSTLTPGGPIHDFLHEAVMK